MLLTSEYKATELKGFHAFIHFINLNFNYISFQWEWRMEK